MLKKRILASSMASVMALTSICSVALADEATGAENYGAKTLEDLNKYLESEEIVTKKNSNDYGATAITNFQNAVQHAEKVAANSASTTTEITAAYRELAACAAKMRHYSKEELEELCNKAKKIIGDGTNRLENTDHDLKYDADKYNKVYLAYEDAAKALENFEYYVEIERRDTVDSAYEALEATMPLDPLPTVNINSYKATMDEIRNLLNQRIKHDAWTRIQLGDTGIDGYKNKTVSYGFFIWRMEEASKEAEQRFDRFNSKNQIITSDPEIVQNWEDAKKLVNVFSAGVNAATVSYDKASARDNDIVNIIGMGGTYHNRLVFDYASVDTPAKLALGTAKADESVDVVAAANAITMAQLKKKSAEYLVNRLLFVLDDLNNDPDAPTTPYKLQYMENAAKTSGAEVWNDITDSTTTMLEMWSLDLKDGKLGAAELKLRVAGGDDGKGHPVFCLYDRDGYLLDFFKTQDDAKNYKAALEAATTESGAVAEFGEATRTGSFNGNYTIDIASKVNLSEFLKADGTAPLTTNPHKVTGTVFNGDGANTITDDWNSIDTNKGNGVNDGLNGDTDTNLGWYGSVPTYNTIFNDAGSYTATPGATDAKHGTSWDPKKSNGDPWVDILTTVDFKKAMELGQNYVDKNYGKVVANNTTNIGAGLTYTTGDNTGNTMANRSDDLIVKVGVDGAGNPIWNDLYQDVLVDTNGDWLSRLEAYPSWYKLDAKGNRLTSTAETTNVYNYVRYALEDVYGDRSTTDVAKRLHTRADIKALVADVRTLTDKTLAYDAWTAMTDKATKAANDAWRWVEKAEKNGSFIDAWTDKGTTQTLAEPEFFDGVKNVAGDWYSQDGHKVKPYAALNLGTTAVDTDQMYHYLKGYYDELDRLYKQFQYTYGEIRNYIVDCELDYAKDASQPAKYRKAIDEAAYALSVVKAREAGLYAGAIYEAFAVDRGFNANNRLNLKGYVDGNEDTQSLTQKNLVDALKNLKAVREGGTVEDPADECKLRGDADDDGVVRAADATVILRHLVVADDSDEKLVKGTDKYKNAAAADGEAGIAAADATAILKYLVNNNKWD